MSAIKTALICEYAKIHPNEEFLVLARGLEAYLKYHLAQCDGQPNVSNPLGEAIPKQAQYNWIMRPIEDFLIDLMEEAETK